MALRMTYHPMAKTFGKPTSGTFDGPDNVMVGYTQYKARYGRYNAGFAEPPDEYLSSKGIPVNYAVWLEPEDVVNGIDTAMEMAKEWISTGPTDATLDHASALLPLVEAAPNPINPRVNIRFRLEQFQKVTLAIYDLAGHEVRVLAADVFSEGPNETLSFTPICGNLCLGSHFENRFHHW